MIYSNRRRFLPLLCILALAGLTLPHLAVGEGKAGAVHVRPEHGDVVVASIGDAIWNDQDGDGRQNEGANAGLDGVAVRLYQDDGDASFEPGADDAQVGATTTAGGGFYHFDLEAVGHFWVQVDSDLATRGYIAHAGPQSRVSPHLVSVSEGTVETGIDFGYLLRGAISGVVFIDADQDGEQGLTEAGMAGVELRLYSDAGGNGQIDAEDVLLARTFSAPDGAFIFQNLLPAHYVLVMTTPGGAQATTPAVIPVQLITGEVSGVSYDFGAYQAGSWRLFAPAIRSQGL